MKFKEFRKKQLKLFFLVSEFNCCDFLEVNLTFFQLTVQFCLASALT